MTSEEKTHFHIIWPIYHGNASIEWPIYNMGSFFSKMGVPQWACEVHLHNDSMTHSGENLSGRNNGGNLYATGYQLLMLFSINLD